MMQQQQQLAVQQDSYMQSRAEALLNVESTIHELGNIFTQLATMVSQQGEIAIRFSRYPIELSLIKRCRNFYFYITWVVVSM
jgi:hypothetical protein